ncbi:MAG: hypothetical protein QME41_02245 [Actinomycetota bacterium]|nr:hypothetical protein [Actinomycetota bacterium]
MRLKIAIINKAAIMALTALLLLPLPVFALPLGEGIQDGGATVRGTKATMYVMQTQPSANHLNTVYVYKDLANMVEFGWCWWGPGWPYGSYSNPGWFLHISNNSISNYEEYTSYGKIINGTFYPGQSPLPGNPTPGTYYPLKVENGGYNSKVWTASVYSNGQWWPKYSKTFSLLADGLSVIGSERANLNDSNYAHWTSCQNIISQPSQPWTNWVAPWQGPNNKWSYDSDYWWRMISATEHYVQHN